ncbi:MAG TPA: glutamate mutase L [Micromonosporaceae bacterium]
MSTAVALCADVGSTFTKAAAVDLDSGALLATATHRTTVDSDVLHGLDAAFGQLTGVLPRDADTRTRLVCSSAGGGLRLAVVGYEELVTAEAGHRVALSAGARVVHVAAGRLDRTGLDQLRASQPDVLLLVGGTDGGDAEVLQHNAARLAAARLSGRSGRIPVVVAGNVEARAEVVDTLTGRGTPVVATDNVLPRIGQLHPQPARAAIRDVFLHHVIGGKRLSRGPRFAELVRGATPDIVLTAVELLADHLAGDLAVVDIGGATTDVYSVLSPDPDLPAAAQAEVAGTLWRSRTVEGDLGVRWNAPGVVHAALAERLLRPEAADQLAGPAQLRASDPAWLPVTGADQAVELRLAELAAVVALRRHARGELSGASHGAGPHRPRTAAKDLRRVRLVIGSGGVLRHAHMPAAAEVLAGVLTDHAGGWALPKRAAVTVDRDYLLAPAGLLAASHPDVALALLRRLVDPPL